MEISLIRHGKSKHSENDRINVQEFKRWVEKYNDSGVIEEESYPFAASEKIFKGKIVVTSDLTRAIESAKLLCPSVKTISNPLFREAELPAVSMNFMNLKLRPHTWAVTLRLIWLLGYSNECESWREAKQRAKKASEQLTVYAFKYNTVSLIGHGFFNRLIAKELQKKGWKGNRISGASHWSCTTFTLVNGSGNRKAIQ